MPVTPIVLQAIGRVVVGWSNAEAYVDMNLAYLKKAGKVEDIPRPLNARLKTMKRACRKPEFLPLQQDGLLVCDLLRSLSTQRNHLIHGIVTQSDKDVITTTVLKEVNSQYLAIQDQVIHLEQLQVLGQSIERASRLLFGFQQRLVSILRLFAAEDGFWEVARLNGDRANQQR